MNTQDQKSDINPYIIEPIQPPSMVKAVITKMVIAKGQEAQFEEIMKPRYEQSKAKGDLGYRLLRSEENPSAYYQIGFWETKEDRMTLQRTKGHGSIAKIGTKEGVNLFSNNPKPKWFDLVAEKQDGVLKFYGSALKKRKNSK